jgi:hypothetical protein
VQGTSRIGDRKDRAARIGETPASVPSAVIRSAVGDALESFHSGSLSAVRLWLFKLPDLAQAQGAASKEISHWMGGQWYGSRDRSREGKGA